MAMDAWIYLIYAFYLFLMQQQNNIALIIIMNDDKLTIS